MLACTLILLAITQVLAYMYVRTLAPPTVPLNKYLQDHYTLNRSHYCLLDSHLRVLLHTYQVTAQRNGATIHKRENGLLACYNVQHKCMLV